MIKWSLPATISWRSVHVNSSSRRGYKKPPQKSTFLSIYLISVGVEMNLDGL